MNARQAIVVPAAIGTVLLIFALTFPVAGQTGIIVNNADSARDTSVAISQGLVDSTTNVQPRIVMEYANTVRPFGLPVPPSALQTFLGQVTPRIVFEYANTNRDIRLSALPGSVGSLLFGQVTPRIIFQYANTNRQLQLGYPVTLVGDTTPPVVTGATTRPVAGGVKITWTTDEFADSEVRYGTQPGVYSQTVRDPLYLKNHEITLTGLSSGVTYYYKTRSTDRSGNTTESQENTLTVSTLLYLPLVRR